MRNENHVNSQQKTKISQKDIDQWLQNEPPQTKIGNQHQSAVNIFHVQWRAIQTALLAVYEVN